MTFNIIIASIQQLLGLCAAGLFYGSVSSFTRYYVEVSTDLFSEDIRESLLKKNIPGWIENIILVFLIVLALVSISMGTNIRN